MPTAPIRAAQYLRMSTEHQRYSLENQALSIGAYAGRHGLRVDRTYEDAGKSGLTIRGRGGLKSLLADILSGSAPFDAVLVLDVSRWGRFQDPDEAAHYEFLCKEAGIAVHYCAEMFENDGSLVSSLLKSLKRVMAGEFSAELSRKTLQAQTRQAARGFKQGGSAPFGFRRLLVDERGEARQLLAPGEQKAMHNERVVYCLGPEAETRALCWIFEQYLSGSHPPAIAAALNAAGVTNSVGARWNAKAVLSALRHDLAVGDYVFNRSTARMRTAQRANPPELWVRTAVLPPSVDPGAFASAKERLLRRGGRRMEADQIREGLKRLHKERGSLSNAIINQCDYLPSNNTVRRKVGHFEAAFLEAGFSGRFDPRRLGSGAPYTRQFLTERLRILYERHGRLSISIIQDDPDTPAIGSFYHLFGDVQSAYATVGYFRTHREACLDGRQLLKRRREKEADLTLD